MRLLLPIALIAACAAPDPDADRDAVLHAWLVADNAVWRSRDPALLAGKYARMAEDPYDFLRGTTGLFYADVTRLGAERPETQFISRHGTEGVLIVGDPHPENLGTVRTPDGAVGIAWTDLDAATWGPWVLDVRRAAQGMAVLASGLPGCDEACALDAATAVAEGYWLEINRDVDTVDVSGGSMVTDLIDEAFEEGEARERLLDNTIVGDDGVRRLVVDEALAADGSGMLALDADDTRRLDAIVAAYDGGSDFRLLGAARRYGQGVSSWPAFRYVLLWDRGAPGDEDDDLLNVREVLSPPAIPSTSRPFASDAARIEFASAALWPSGADPSAAAVGIGNQSYKILSWSSRFQNLDHLKIREAWDDGDLEPADVVALGTFVGDVLALAHMSGTMANGGVPDPAIRSELTSRRSELSDEIRRDAAIDLARTQDDYARFQALLDEWGPWLGADMLEGVP